MLILVILFWFKLIVCNDIKLVWCLFLVKLKNFLKLEIVYVVCEICNNCYFFCDFRRNINIYFDWIMSMIFIIVVLFFINSFLVFFVFGFGFFFFLFEKKFILVIFGFFGDLVFLLFVIFFNDKNKD